MAGKMKILVIGGGGREHALVWKIANDSARPAVFCAPGNAGTTEMATNVPISAEDVPALFQWARQNRPDLTVVGPEAPLCAGLVDRFEAEKLRVFGPCQAAAQLEGSKVFAKEVMTAAGVPTASAKQFTDPSKAMAHVRKSGTPVVVKADGLAAGKGVTVCRTVEEAERAIREAMIDKAFGSSGSRVIVEECLEGEEASILAMIDGKNVVLLASAQDHKRIFDNDQGPNTGGMGVYSPAPVVTDKWLRVIREQVFERILAELKKRKITYKGILYAGVMMTDAGPKVLEFNCRFGDPETQAIIPRIEGNFVPALEACIDGTLTEGTIRWKREPCVCVVMAAGGYPGKYEKGAEITGLNDVRSMKDVIVFHAGTRKDGERAVTSGGRVLGVTALGHDLAKAVDTVYMAVSKIKFDGAQYRKDIAARALRKPSGKS